MLKKNKLVIKCLKSVFIQKKEYFKKDKIYIAYVEGDSELYSINEFGERHTLCFSKGHLWHTDEWFNECFFEDKKQTMQLLKREALQHRNNSGEIEKEDLKTKKQHCFKKLDEDDILEILIEHFQDGELEDYISAQGCLLGKPNENLRFIGVFSNDDNEMLQYDLKKLDKEIDFNGDHSTLTEDNLF